VEELALGALALGPRQLHADRDRRQRRALLAAGVPAAKLGVGTGFYGECYTAPVTGPSQALGASMVAASDGTMSYANVMASYWSSSTYHYDMAAQVPWLLPDSNNAQKCTYVSYEDATSIAAKGAWAKSQGLGGVIIWELSEGLRAQGRGERAGAEPAARGDEDGVPPVGGGPPLSGWSGSRSGTTRR
jgi:GH18 family chitinase